MIKDPSVIYESKKMSLDEYSKKIAVERLADNVKAFINQTQKARVITGADSLANYKTVYVEKGHPVFRKDFGNLITINLSNILTEYEITDSQLVAVKLWKVKGVCTVEVLKFPLENYGKTWRCWTAVPTADQIRKVKW
jgi:hypothetical protein